VCSCAASDRSARKDGGGSRSARPTAAPV